MLRRLLALRAAALRGSSRCRWRRSSSFAASTSRDRCSWATSCTRPSARDSGLLLRDGGLLALLLVVLQSLTFVQMYTMQMAGARAMADLRSAVFRFFQTPAPRYYDRTPVGRLVTRATNDVDALSELFASGALNAMGDLISLVGVVAMMIALDWRLSVVSFLALPVVGAHRELRPQAVARGVPRRARAHRAPQRVLERAGERHRRRAGVRPRARDGRGVRRDQRRLPRRATSAPSTTRRCSTPPSRW